MRRIWLTFENRVSKILEESYVKIIMTPIRECIKRLMTVDKAKEVSRDHSIWRSILSDYPTRDIM